MKFINEDILNVDDFKNLDKISLPTDPRHYHIKNVCNHREDLKKSYINYIFFTKKYRLLDVPINSSIQKIGKKSFIEHYDNPKKFSDFIDDFREKNRSDFCYMCGGLNAGTLDHILPKDIYPEFSFFSKNLVPSCECNSKKNTNLSSALNPHFYQECDAELYCLDIKNISEANNQISFEFEIKVNNIPKIKSILEKHLENHILKYSDINNYMKNHISEMLSNPFEAFSIDEKMSRNEIKRSINILLKGAKFQSKSENRWDVILYKGFLANHVLDFIELKVNQKFL